jgi:hypothetical protein
VLTRDVRLEGFTTADWVRLAEVFRSPGPSPEREEVTREERAPSGRPRGGIIAVTTAGRLRKLIGTELGRLDVAAQPWPEPLEDLALRHGTRWALELKSGALDTLMERFALRLQREQDALAQIVSFVGVLRELEAEGQIRVWPWKLSAWPVPHERVLVRALDALCPDGKSLLLGVFQGGEVFTSIVARRKGTGFDLLLGPDRLRSEMGLVSGDWRRDYRHLSRAAERAAGPLAIGCFGELETLRALTDKPSPGAWAAAVAARDIVLSPAVPAVAIPLGVDVGRAAIVAVRDLAERMGAGSWFGSDSPFAPALQRVRDLAGVDRDINELLGFDPIVLLKRLFSRGGER